MNRGCLVVIDVQQALVDEGPEDVGPFLDRLAQLMAAARASGTPVLHVQHCGPVGDELEPETAGWQISSAVAPTGGEPVFAKHFNSAFRSTGLEDWLRTRQLTTLVICGMQTEHCIDASIKAAFDRGFQVVVPEGVHTTFANGGLTAGQLRGFYQDRIWKDRYAAVKSVDEVIATFRGR